MFFRNPFWRALDQWEHGDSLSSTTTITVELIDSFQKFLNQALKQHVNPEGLEHYFDRCFSCVITYDYVGHVENWEEMDFVVRNSFYQYDSNDNNEQLKAFQKNFQNFTSILEQRYNVYYELLKKMPANLLRGLERKYQADAVMFGYM